MQRENYTIQKNYHKNKKNVSKIKRFILLPYCIQIHTLISKITSCDRNFQIWWDWITRCVKWDFTGHFRSLVTWKIITRYQKEIIERYILKTNVIKYRIYGLILNLILECSTFCQPLFLVHLAKIHEQLWQKINQFFADLRKPDSNVCCK